MAAPIVQYVVIRSDLKSSLKWPTGALIAQACHACTAAIHQFYSDEDTQAYLSDVDRMHKIVLDGKDEDSLKMLADRLEANNIKHKLWREQPEDIITCLATKPCNKSLVQSYFKEFKLLR